MKKPAQRLIAEVPRRHAKIEMTIGIDLGDVWSHYWTLNEGGEVVGRGRFRTTPKAIAKWFTDLPPARIAMEAGTHSIWINEQLQELGHEVIVANVRELRAISHSDRKSDHADAEKLARFARLDPQILRPISHRTVELQEALTLIRARALVVRPLTFILTLGNTERFKRSRDVGCYLGLRPRRSQSGDRDPQLGITKAGNVYLRSLLIECANHILRPRRKDSSLRRWGLHLAERGGKQARNKAVVAVARKLAACSTTSGLHKKPTYPSTQQQLEDAPCVHPLR